MNWVIWLYFAPGVLSLLILVCNVNYYDKSDQFWRSWYLVLVPVLNLILPLFTIAAVIEYGLVRLDAWKLKREREKLEEEL